MKPIVNGTSVVQCEKVNTKLFIIVTITTPSDCQEECVTWNRIFQLCTWSRYVPFASSIWRFVGFLLLLSLLLLLLIIIIIIMSCVLFLASASVNRDVKLLFTLTKCNSYYCSCNFCMSLQREKERERKHHSFLGFQSCYYNRERYS